MGRCFYFMTERNVSDYRIAKYSSKSCCFGITCLLKIDTHLVFPPRSLYAQWSPSSSTTSTCAPLLGCLWRDCTFIACWRSCGTSTTATLGSTTLWAGAFRQLSLVRPQPRTQTHTVSPETKQQMMAKHLRAVTRLCSQGCDLHG